MNRRGFMQSILALGMAPAIVKAENLMKIFVPSQEIIIPKQTLFDGVGDYLDLPDQTVETWAKAADIPEWTHVAIVRQANMIKTYINGAEAPLPKSMTFMQGIKILGESITGFSTDKFVSISELRITDAARPIEQFLKHIPENEHRAILTYPNL